MKKNCRLFKKENKKDKKGNKKAEGESNNIKIKEVNALSGDSGIQEGDILRTSNKEMATLVTTNDITVQDLIMELGASFHVTPHHGWFTKYDAKRMGRV